MMPACLAAFTIIWIAVTPISSGEGKAVGSPPSASPQPSPTPSAAATPPGITSTTTTLKAILEMNRLAIGKPTAPLLTDVETGTVSAYGLTGTYRVAIDHKNWRRSETLGTFTTQYGEYNGVKWNQNENGLTVTLHGVHQRDEISALALANTPGTDDPNVRLLGQVAAPAHAYVIEVNPPNGRHEFLFFDLATHLLVRSEEITSQGRFVSTFDEYRRVNGIMEAWHRHYSDGHAQNETDYTTTSDDVNGTVDPSQVAMAGISRPLVEFPAGVTSVRLPAHVDYGTIVVRVTINGRGLDFALDSGASTIVIDRDVAKQLGLQTFGKSFETTAGPYEQSKALIPEMSIGQVTMRNVVVDSLPFAMDFEQGTKIVWLLGFDFIGDNIVKVDYDHGEVDIMQHEAFAAPADASYVDALLDDGVPMVSASINGAVGNHFILDTGADGVMIFNEFAQAHPSEVADLGEGRILNRYLRYLSAQGVGGEIELSAVQIKDFLFGPVHFQRFVAFRTNSTSFQGEDADGLIGYDFLRSFNLYFDYLDGRVYLQPNELLKRTGTKMQ